MFFHHPWNLTPKEAVALQSDLAKKVVTEGEPAINFVAGVDVHPAEKTGMMRAAICVLSYPALELVEQKTALVKTSFPYVPGLLSFREGPAVLAVFQKLKHRPDIILFDGQGIAHPRRFGLASHIGLLLEIPAIGCAKSRLYGSCGEPGRHKGDLSYLFNEKREIIGACLRTRDNVKPLYVSAGHNVSLDFALKTVLACCVKHRQPEPLRLAHRLAQNA
ncbi:MAG: deoxyribonuclease V [Nitrospinae bacterium]|nr:deoxyribonuclease V [Nitrospinota bacterium]